MKGEFNSPNAVQNLKKKVIPKRAEENQRFLISVKYFLGLQKTKTTDLLTEGRIPLSLKKLK